jgi:hypothetical protein
MRCFEISWTPQQRRCAPSPLVGEGWGEGLRSIDGAKPLTRIASAMQSDLSHRGRGGTECAAPGCAKLLELRDNHGAATSAELRILRQGSAAEFNGSADLLLRMHVLCGLRREQALQCLPELRRRFCAAPDPAGDPTAARRFGATTSAIGQTRASQIQSGRCCRAVGEAARYSAGAAVNYSSRRHSWMVRRTIPRDSGFDAPHRPGMTGWIIPPPRSSPQPRRNRRDSHRPGTSRASRANRRLRETSVLFPPAIRPARCRSS